MQTRIRNIQQAQASVLTITLVLAGILVLSLAGYLTWAAGQNRMVAESQSWNRALALAEAGIEDGLAQINAGFGTNYLPSAATNWTYSTGVYGPHSATLVDGSFSAILIPSNPSPVIISTGYVSAPILSRSIARTVRVDTGLVSAFGDAIVALQNITFNGNDIAIDSFDSTDPNHSTNGMYNAATRKAGGDVASTYGLVDIGNANVNGKVRTGPAAGLNVGAQGFAGDLNFTGPGVEDGWWIKDFNSDVKAVVAPDTSSFIQPTSDATNKYVLGSGGYILNGDLSLKAGDTILVNGDATLYVSGNFTMQGGSGGKSDAAINIAPGCTLRVFVAGATATLTDINTSGTSKSFQYYGLPSNTSMSWGGNATYVGTVYAPSAALTLGGGGNNHYDYQGACVCYSVTMNGHFNFHYDEDLKRHGPFLGFAVIAWQEL